MFSSLKRNVEIGRLSVAISNGMGSKFAPGVDLLPPLVSGSGADEEDPEDVEERGSGPVPGSSKEVACTAFGLGDAQCHPRPAGAGSTSCFTRLWLQILLCATIPNVAFAQSDSTIVMEGLTITGNRIDIPFEEASRNIFVIEKQDIQKQPALSVPEVLSYTPGVDIRQRGPLGVQADIGIRGGTFEQTLVLVNGIKLTDPQTGHHSMNVPVPLQNIERIEVLKGPGARIFGQNAFAGAVNFITRVPDQREVSLNVAGGSFGTGSGSATLSLPVGSYRQSITYSRAFSDGYRHNTDFSIANAFYQGRMETGDGRLTIMAGLANRKFGANGFYASPNATEQYEEVRTSLVSVGYQHQGHQVRWSPRIYWRQNRDRYLFIRNNPGVYENDHTTDVAGIEWNGSVEWAQGTTGFGLEMRHEGIAGDWVRGGERSGSNLDGFDRKNFGAYLEHRLSIGDRVDVTPGMYTGWYTDFGWNFMPGIDVGYQLAEATRIYANVGKSFRIPTFFDQYYESPTELGDQDLKPEQAVSYELGIKNAGRWHSAEANLFYRDASSVIDWVYDAGDSLWRAGNHSNVQASGLEFSMMLDFEQLVGPQCVVSKLHLSYNHIRQDLSNGENIMSRYALEHIRHQWILNLDHRIVARLRNHFAVRYIDRIGQSPYWLIDDRLYWEQNQRLRLFVEVTNLADTQYTEVMTTMPGRWFRGGLHWQFAF